MSPASTSLHHLAAWQPLSQPADSLCTVGACAPAVVNASTWKMPPDPPLLQGCRPANSSTTLTLPGNNYMYRLVTTTTNMNAARNRCWQNVDSVGNSNVGGRLWTPRDLAEAKQVEAYFEAQNPDLDRYWIGLKQVTVSSIAKYVHQDSTR